ncbi:MAG: choice-of-anchor tandem repeat GloVer-containing protein [Candidatus Sulfotelmatobacter sp.]
MTKLPKSKMTSLLFVFCVSAAIAAPAQTYTDLYDMGASSADPNDPQWSGIIAQGRDGNMYSTTNQNWTGGQGDVFRITPTGTVTVLHTFNGTDGQHPTGGLTLGSDGNFYGTTDAGGAFGYGTLFRITPEGSLTRLYSFTNGADGSGPSAPPIEGVDGNFYGTTGGTQGNNGGTDDTHGSVYKITPSGVFTTLHTFAGTDGANPLGPLFQASDGNFYGTTFYGGTSGAGAIFKIGPLGKFEVLFNFGDVPGNPFGGLIQGSDGNLYGTTSGSQSGGIVFELTPSDKLTVLHNFAGGSDGGDIGAGLVQATDGNFYGTNCIGPLAFAGGVVFRVSSTGGFDDLHQFDGTSGGSAQDTPFQHTNGQLYGTTAVGGAYDRGVFYSLDVGLKPFVSFLPAARPVGGIVQILGQGFTGTASVSFNGTPAGFTVYTDTFLMAKVPAGATTGNITVTEPSGTLTSNKIFRVTPDTRGFSPINGPVGTVVTIAGIALTQTTAVSFGGVQATSFSVVSDTEVQATVPAGAITGHIEITTAGGTFTTCNTFTVTP